VPDTYTWLLTAADPCPACGAQVSPGDVRCAACGRELTALYRPPSRSSAVVTLASLWGIGAAAALLMAIGSVLQERGLLSAQPGADDGGPVLRGVARAVELLGAPALDAPVVTPETPAWLAPALAVAALLAGALAWLCWARRPAGLYGGLAASLGLALAGVGAGVVWGWAGVLVMAACLAAGAALGLGHLGAARELLGERRRIVATSSATSAAGLFREGRAQYEAGLTFLAARSWARALGKDPANPVYLHALGLALARLGEYERARGTLERAAALAPGDERIGAALEQVRRGGIGGGT
jgi:tetratricopeptide (TPR) repeat protein